MDSELHRTKTAPRPAPGAGTGLFSTTSILKGHSVCRLESNFATVLDTERLVDTCSYCFGNRSIVPRSLGRENEHAFGLKICTGCRVVRYCDKACQAASWSAAHKHECAIYKDLHPRVLPVNSRAVLRILFLKSGKIKDVTQAAQQIQSFENLQSHIQEISQINKEQYERIVLSAKAVHQYSKTNIDLSTIIGYFAKLEINSFNLTTPFYDHLGLCIHPFVSHINHSCAPNAVVGFDEGKVIVTALRQIEEGEEILISYLDNTDPTGKRQRELLERYYFKCRCPKCHEELQASEDQFLSSASLDTAAFKDAERKAIDMQSTARKVASPLQAVEKLQSAMKILYGTGLWPIARQPYSHLRDDLISLLIEANNIQDAFIHAAIRYLRIDPIIYGQFWHPIRNVHAWLLVKLAEIVMYDSLNADSDFTKIQTYEIKLAHVIYSIMMKLNNDVGAELPSVGKIYETKFKEVSGALGLSHMNAASIKEDIELQWGKLNKMVDDALRAESC